MRSIIEVLVLCSAAGALFGLGDIDASPWIAVPISAAVGSLMIAMEQARIQHRRLLAAEAERDRLNALCAQLHHGACALAIARKPDIGGQL